MSDVLPILVSKLMQDTITYCKISVIISLMPVSMFIKSKDLMEKDMGTYLTLSVTSINLYGCSTSSKT